jgi:hypothetical protein
MEKEATSKMTKNKDVEQWLVDSLKGQNISKLFGLIRIQYHKMKSIKHGPFIWVCNQHKKEHLAKGILKDCPITSTYFPLFNQHDFDLIVKFVMFVI